MRTHDVSQRVFLFRRKVRRVALAEHEQALMPKHRQRALRVRIAESDKVEHERVEHLVRQCVLLVQQDADEERGGSYPRAHESLEGAEVDEKEELRTRVVHPCEADERS